jgi:hypothetical protein
MQLNASRLNAEAQRTQRVAEKSGVNQARQILYR